MWVECAVERGGKMAVGIVYVNLERVRIQETESLFEVLESDVVAFEGNGYEMILMGDFNARIGLGEEAYPNSNGRWLVHLVGVGVWTIEKEMINYEVTWT